MTGAAQAFGTSLEVEADVHVLVVRGEIDLSVRDELIAAIDAAARAGRGHLLVDLTGVSFMDSVGLHCLIRCARSLGASHRRLAVCCVPGVVRTLFDVTGIGQALEVHDGRGAAVAALAEGAGADGGPPREPG